MGNRGNICVHFEDMKKVYLYTHWQGSEIKKMLKTALSSQAGRGRWNDPQYLTRIIFCEMVGEEHLKGETGFGISPSLHDNGHPILHVFPDTQTVQEKTENGKVLTTWTFNSFVGAL